jgi:6-phosphofructokinase 1
MGRNAGWLTASAKLASLTGYGADLIYLPEVPFSIEKFKSDVTEVVNRKQKCIIAVSEGIKNADGKYVGEDASATDVFGHYALGGVCGVLKSAVKSLGYKCKAIELNILQRCASHIASKTDIEESLGVGASAVKLALAGESGVMATIVRNDTAEYSVSFGKADIRNIANEIKSVPRNYINADGDGVTDECIEYLKPLIVGEVFPKYENGMPKHIKI